MKTIYVKNYNVIDKHLKISIKKSMNPSSRFKRIALKLAFLEKFRHLNNSFCCKKIEDSNLFKLFNKKLKINLHPSNSNNNKITFIL
jgi:hypothetical protein